MESIKKISIIGGSGTGKTTLSNNLGKKLHLPIYHIDAFHYSTLARIKGVLKRYFKNSGNEKEEIPGCKERISFGLMKSVLRWKRHKRSQIIEILKVVEKDKIIVFQNRKQLNAWYDNQFSEKIEL